MESISEAVVEFTLITPFVSTALKVAAASAKECSFESSSGWVGLSLGVVIVMPVLVGIEDLEEIIDDVA